MAGTKAGGQKAASTNKTKYGKDFYAEIGRKGGKNGHTGGFAANPELAKIAGAKGGIKFKPDLPETATAVLMEQAVGRVKALKHEFIDDGKGGKRLVFKDATDAIMRNAEKQLEPYTIGDLLVKELKTMGVLDEGRQQQGVGTSAPRVTQTKDGLVIDLSGVRTQTEAQEVIAQALMKQGITNGSKAFQEAQTKAWTDNTIASSPIK